MPETQSGYPLPISPASLEASALHLTSIDSSHPPRNSGGHDSQFMLPHQYKERAKSLRSITSSTCKTTDIQHTTTLLREKAESEATPKALACAVVDKVLEVFKALEQPIFFRDWQKLDELKENVNGALLNDLFVYLARFDKSLDICCSKFEQTCARLRHYLTSAEPTSGKNQAGEMDNGKRILEAIVELDEKIGKLGWSLQDDMSQRTEQVRLSIREYKELIDSEHKFGWKRQQTIEAQQEWVEVVGSSAIPECSGPITAVANVVGKTAILSVISSQKEDSEIVTIHQEMYMQEKARATELEENIKFSQGKIQEACEAWQSAKDIFIVNERTKFIVWTLQRMSLMDVNVFLNLQRAMCQANEHLVVLKTPIRQLVTQLTPYYKPGVHVIREVKTFTRYVPNIARGLALLLSAKKIVTDSNEEDFEQAVLSLCAVTLEQVQAIQDIYGKWITRIKPERQDVFRRRTEAFENQSQCHIEKIRGTLAHHVSQTKSERALIERNESDRYHKNWHWEGRPVINSDEALDALRRVKRCVFAIYHLSVLSATARNGDQTSYDQAQLKELPSETLHKCDSPKTRIPMVLSTVASALNHLITSRGRKAPSIKPQGLRSRVNGLLGRWMA